MKTCSKRYIVDVLPMNRNIVVMQATASTINSLVNGTVAYIKNHLSPEGIYEWNIYDINRDYNRVKSGMVSTSSTKTQVAYPADFKIL